MAAHWSRQLELLRLFSQVVSRCMTIHVGATVAFLQSLSDRVCTATAVTMMFWRLLCLPVMMICW